MIGLLETLASLLLFWRRPVDETPAHPEPVRLIHAKTPAEAQVVTALLRAAGIPVYVAGRRLADEFGVTQAAMGLAQVDVQVPADRLAEALAARGGAGVTRHLWSVTDLKKTPFPRRWYSYAPQLLLRRS